MSVRRIPAAATRDLRQRVLRPDQRLDQLARPGEDDLRTAHFGAFDEAGGLMAIATVMPEREPEDGLGDWRLRGVATEPSARGRGHGSAVVRACLDHARSEGGACAWLNGRVASRAFYERLGFVVVGEAFDTPPTGPHHRFRARLG